MFFPRFTRKIDKMWVLEHHLGLEKKNKLLYRGHVDLLSVLSMALAQPKLGVSNPPRTETRSPPSGCP